MRKYAVALFLVVVVVDSWYVVEEEDLCLLCLDIPDDWVMSEVVPVVYMSSILLNTWSMFLVEHSINLHTYSALSVRVRRTLIGRWCKWTYRLPILHICTWTVNDTRAHQRAKVTQSVYVVHHICTFCPYSGFTGSWRTLHTSTVYWIQYATPYHAALVEFPHYFS